MLAIDTLLARIALLLADRGTINAFFRVPSNTAILVGALIAVCGALLGSFLLLRGMALTSDAISHTVLLGIVVAFMVMGALGTEPDVSSPWLILGAAAAGVATVVLTEAIHRSGLVRQDAALGLAFPLLFALAVIFVSRFVEDAHIDEDAVMVGEIGVAWANTSSVCLSGCEEVTIESTDSLAEIARQCTNCREAGISPRDAAAEFEEICTNCGTYSPGQAWQAGLIDEEPVLLFWPKSVSVMLMLTLLTVVLIGVFFKELKLSTFDPGLARSLGFRPGLMTYLLMVLVSLVAVGAFDAVGSILVVAFFIVPPAAAYLLTDRLGAMLALSSLIGAVAAYLGYGLGERWDSSISASIVVVMLGLFIVSWIISPRYGVLSTLAKRFRRDRLFREQVMMGHVAHHHGLENATQELTASTMHLHTRWSPDHTRKVMDRLTDRGLISISQGVVQLTDQGRESVQAFRSEMLGVPE